MATGTELKASSRRKHVSKMRDIKMGIRRMDKFMNTLLKVQNAIKVIISEVAAIEGVILALGASPLRPQHIYALNFSHGTAGSKVSDDFARSKAAEGLSRKVSYTDHMFVVQIMMQCAFVRGRRAGGYVSCFV